MDLLRIIRSKAGPHRTVGISDEDIKRFLANDVYLGLAIKSAHELWLTLDPATTYERSELDLIHDVYADWCNFYAEDTVNPYVPLFAKGPWIITLHGAVVHDSGGYGMLGFGHNPDDVLKILARPQVMANIMTPSLSQKTLMTALRKEIGHTHTDKRCPYDQFILMNSGSEGNSVVDRIIDIHTGHARGERSKVVGVSLRQSFHGRTLKPAVISDSSAAKYISSKCDTLTRMKREYNRIVEPNDIEGLKRVFSEADEKGEFVEAVYLEAVMGEGNPGQRINPEFYMAAHNLTIEHNAMLVIDSVQAGIRCHGVLSIVDYPGFQDMPCPDFEVFSKALNGGQYPVSLIALSSRAVASYKRGVYGNTMTTAPRACEVAACIVSSFSAENAVIRKNIPEMGKYAVEQFKKLQAKYPKAITNVTGTGLLYAVHLDPHVYPVVAVAGAEYWLRTQGVGVIHGGENALRFTPHFRVTAAEIDLQVNTLERFMKATGYLTPQLEMIENAVEGVKGRTGSDFAGETALFFIKGHLFDKNVVNKILNTVETNECMANITRLRLGCCATEESEMTLEIRALQGEGIAKVTPLVAETCAAHNCVFKPTDAGTEKARL
jgi:acetylornithine/succinyldiaminopimelate/putrescine aminotransferase